MTSSLHKYGPTWILLIATTAFLGYMYQDVLLHPNSFFFDDSGDGIKNYFTFTAQSNSSTWIQSPIMNYPYGENFLYLDCHPLLTWILHGLDNVFPGITNYSVGILHILIIVSLLLSALFLYLILCELHLNRWWAMAGAFGIMVLSPQVFRMTGHLALSYAVFIPLTWYLTIRFFKGQHQLIWSLLIAVNVLFWFLTHTYLGMIALAFIALQLLAEFFIFKKRTIAFIQKWVHFGIQVLAPALIFWSFITFTDHHIGRTTNPWGIFANNANLKTIFLPHHGILRKWLNHIVSFDNQNWDGWAYIGISSTLIFVLLIVGWIQKRRNQSTGLTTLYNQIKDQPVLSRALVAAVLLLLFAMALPFRLGLQFLLEWFPVIKKFRGNGRFAWVFYYVMTVTSVYALHYIYYHPKLISSVRQAVKVISILLLLLYIGEGWPYHRDVSGQYGKKANTFSSHHLPDFYQDGLDVIDTAEFQAILPLPFYQKGSENFTIEGTDKTRRNSMTIAYHTRLPIWGNYATHTSIPESKKSIQTLSPDYYHKAIKDDLSSAKNVIIVYSKEDLNRYEKDMLMKGEIFFSNDQFELYRLPVVQIFQSSAKEKIKSFQLKIEKNELYKKDDFYISDSSSFFLYESFEDSSAPFHIEGEGAYHGQLYERKPLWTVPAGTLKEDTRYELSFWFSNFGKNFGQDITDVKIFVNEIMGDGRRAALLEIRPSYSMVIKGDWSLVEMEFVPQDPGHVIEIFLKGPWKGKGEYYIDELLLREKGVDIYKILKKEDHNTTGLMWNNQRIFF